MSQNGKGDKERFTRDENWRNNYDSIFGKTSEEWLQEPEYEGVTIYDPDGWDRSNYEYSFCQEKISKNEFKKRLLSSTIMIQGK